MSRTFAIAAVALTMCAAQPSVAFAETELQAQRELEVTPAGQVVEGKISAVKGRWIVFSNGTQVAVPDNLVQPGAVIRAMYEEREGQKFATSIELRDPATGPK